MNYSGHGLRFRLDHHWTGLRMSAYVDSELRVRQRRRLERHTAECEECRVVLEGLRRMLALLGSTPAPAPIIDGSVVASNVLRRLNEHSAG